MNTNNSHQFGANMFMTQKTNESLSPSFTTTSSKSSNLFPPRVQEMVLIDELLSALCGFEGKYITLANKPTIPQTSFALPTRYESFVLGDGGDKQQEQEFQLSQGHVWDPSLSYQVQRILPLCNKYLTIMSFIQSRDCSYEFGQVSQALIGGIKILMREYLVVVAQLESLFQKQNLTLQKIWLHVQQPLRTLSAIETLTTEIRTQNAKGGALLSIIHRLTLSMAGDAETQKLFQFLMERSCVPYFKMVNDWVHNGKLDDLNGEFMIHSDVKEDDSTADSAWIYWEKRFTIRKEHVPEFLNESIITKILQSGKYLNVLSLSHQSNNVISPDDQKVEKIEYTSNKREYVTKIDSSYSIASKKLVHNIMKEQKLMDLLNTIRDIFLFKKGDFFVHFMDNSESELTKKAAHIMHSKLQSLLELSLKSSSANEIAGITAELLLTPISATLDSQRLSLPSHGIQRDTFALNGIEAFTIKPLVTFPLSIIVNQNAIHCYQLLFRHLFQCKCVERSLLRAWLEHKSCREYSLGNSVAPMYALRQKMLHFTRELLFFSFNEIERNFVVMEQKISKAETFDEIITSHQQFVENCMSVCMLNLQKPFRALSKVLSTCKVFSDYMIHFTKGLTLVDEDLLHERSANASDIFERRRMHVKVVSEHARKNAQSELNSIAQFSKNFEESYQLLLDSLRTANGSETSNILSHFSQMFIISQY